jgi:PBP4 family serine-type D-alanyl-D-alanine carboxypeptidase
MHRTSLGQLSWNLLDSLQRLNSGDANEKTIYYSNFYPEDIALIQKYFKARKIKVNLKRLSESAAKSESAQEIMSSTSPTLREILDWTLTWSDNVLADRVARSAAYSAGFTRDHDGISKTFHALMNELGINDTGLIVKDGSGLSKENRVTAKQISELLMFLAHNEKYSPLLAGLPIGGETGTLAERFIDTAPNAIGLVRAKTGTLNGTTNLAGFVQSADHEYIFVIIADQHSKSYTVTKRVRATVDRILGKIAKPLLPELIQIAPSSESATTLSN